MRTDFFNLMHMNDEALAQYNSSSSLKHMVTKIRREGQHSVTAAFERYQHKRDLVSLLNKFAETSRELLSGWESKIDRSGKQFFIDHSSRSTTFVDPRLPLDVPVVNPHKLVLSPSRRRVRNTTTLVTTQTTDTPEETNVCSSPVPPPRPPTTSVSTPTVPIVPTIYNDKVVAFLRKPNIVDILCERRPTIQWNASVRDKVYTFRADGTPALDRFSDDIELTIILSLFSQEIFWTGDHVLHADKWPLETIDLIIATSLACDTEIPDPSGAPLRPLIAVTSTPSYATSTANWSRRALVRDPTRWSSTWDVTTSWRTSSPK